MAEDADGCAIATSGPKDDLLLGTLRDCAEELDEIVEEAMRRRRISAWLPSADDFEMLGWVSVESGRPLTALLDEALRAWLEPWRLRRLNASESSSSGGSDRSRMLEVILEFASPMLEDELSPSLHDTKGLDVTAAPKQK